MKKLLLLIVFTVTFVLGVKADETTKEELKQMGVYYGNPIENKIIAQGEMYVVIHNPTELSLTVMDQEAQTYCKNKSARYKYITYFMRMLGKYTAYFSCEMEDKIDQYDLTEEEEKCIIDRYYERENCLKLNSKNAGIINAIELQKIAEGKFKKLDFIHQIKIKYYDQIESLEQNAEQKSISFQDQLSIDRNMKICKKYKFEEGSQLFGECILKLIEKGNLKFFKLK